MNETRDLKELREEFENALIKTNREGMKELIEAIRKTDFYSSPASSKYHGAYEGGLLVHSINVWNCLKAKKESSVWGPVFHENNYSDDSLAIVTLLHDLCKANTYVTDYKNQKTYDEDKVKAAERWQVKHDNNGDFIWEVVPFYTVDDQAPYGHGEKSVDMITQYIKLTPAEKYAIRWHMGAYDATPKQLYTLSSAIEKYPLVLALQEADMEATHLLEVEEE